MSDNVTCNCVNSTLNITEVLLKCLTIHEGHWVEF